MKTALSKVAATVAFVIGAMAVLAGGKVLLGNSPDYYVINWLPVYNYTIGILTIFVTAILIWANSKAALAAGIVTLSANAAVMLILQTAYRDVVAPDSIRAMTVRLTAWVIILALMAAQLRKGKAAQPANVAV